MRCRGGCHGAQMVGAGLEVVRIPERIRLETMGVRNREEDPGTERGVPEQRRGSQEQRGGSRNREEDPGTERGIPEP